MTRTVNRGMQRVKFSAPPNLFVFVLPGPSSRVTTPGSVSFRLFKSFLVIVKITFRSRLRRRRGVLIKFPAASSRRRRVKVRV